MDLKITRINEKSKLQKYTQNDSTYVHFKILCIGERHTQMWEKIKTETERLYANLRTVVASGQKRR